MAVMGSKFIFSDRVWVNPFLSSINMVMAFNLQYSFSVNPSFSEGLPHKLFKFL